MHGCTEQNESPHILFRSIHLFCSWLVCHSKLESCKVIKMLIDYPETRDNIHHLKDWMFGPPEPEIAGVTEKISAIFMLKLDIAALESLGQC